MLLLRDLNGLSIPNPLVEMHVLTSLLEGLNLATNGFRDGSSRIEVQECVNTN